MEAPQKRAGRPKDDQLTARRTDEILDVAARLFAAQGYPSTDLQVVADELGVGKGTIYRYFPTKRDLFLATVDRGMQRLTSYIAQAMTAPDGLNQMEQGIRAYLAFFEAHQEFAELLIQERANFRDRPEPTYFEYRDANVERFEGLVRGLVAAGRLRDLPLEMICGVIGDLLYGTMFTNYFAGRKRSLDEQVGEIVGVVLVGLLSDAERAKRLAGGTPTPPAGRSPSASEGQER
jgi:AcrR family transcriptional regulator